MEFRAAVSEYKYVSLCVLRCFFCYAFHWQYDACRYKVHYVGYSSKHDEWKCESDLVPISEEEEESE